MTDIEMLKKKDPEAAELVETATPAEQGMMLYFCWGMLAEQSKKEA